MQDKWESLPVLLSVKDVASLLGLGKARTYALLAQEDFPKVKIGKTFKVYPASLKRWLEEGYTA